MSDKNSNDVAVDRRRTGELIDLMIQNLPANSPMLRDATESILRFCDRVDHGSFIRGYVCGHFDGMNYDTRSLPLWQRKHVAEKARTLHRLHRCLKNGGYGGDEYGEIMSRLDAVCAGKNK